MKVKFTYTPTIYIGTCAHCGETHLAEKFGDAIIDGQPVCAACQRRPRTTERSEGVSATEQREGASANPDE
jgi:formylmethanofuran dehydrogenase subunit E